MEIAIEQEVIACLKHMMRRNTHVSKIEYQIDNQDFIDYMTEVLLDAKESFDKSSGYRLSTHLYSKLKYGVLNYYTKLGRAAEKTSRVDPQEYCNQRRSVPLSSYTALSNKLYEWIECAPYEEINKCILWDYFRRPLTAKELAVEYGISHTRVNKILHIKELTKEVRKMTEDL